MTSTITTGDRRMGKPVTVKCHLCTPAALLEPDEPASPLTEHTAWSRAMDHALDSHLAELKADADEVSRSFTINIPGHRPCALRQPCTPSVAPQ